MKLAYDVQEVRYRALGVSYVELSEGGSERAEMFIENRDNWVEMECAESEIVQPGD